MAFVLDQTKPNQKYFEAICGIPHPSTEEKAVSDYVCSVAEKLGLNYEQDKLGNVIVRKPASKGYEDAPVVMLEGHMDMVCVKTPESTHDFSSHIAYSKRPISKVSWNRPFVLFSSTFLPPARSCQK